MINQEWLERLEAAAADREPTIPLGPQTRTLEVRLESVDEDARTVEVSFSSERPVERWWGVEVLRHTAEAIDLERAERGIPVLDEHRRQIGIGENVRLKGKKLWARVRFGASQVAEETFRDVASGIRKFTSAGYRNQLLREIKPRKLPGEVEADPERGDMIMGWGGPRPAGEGRARRWFDVVRWALYEFSFVSVPADPTVGARADDEDLRQVGVEWLEGRAEDTGAADAPDTNGGEEMLRQGRDGTTPLLERDDGHGDGGGGTATVTREQEAEFAQRGAEAERKRIAEITAIGERHNRELIPTAITEGWTIERMNHEVLASLPTPEAAAEVARQQESPEIGMSRKQVREYSICRAIMQHADNRWNEPSLEREASDEVGKLYGRKASGFFLPYDVMSRGLLLEKGLDLAPEVRADLTTSTGSGAVGTITLADAFIDVLRARTQMVPLGATVLSGLRSTISIPKLSTGGTAGWVAEGSGTGESSMVIGALSLSPHTVRARQDISRRLMLQSTPMADAIVMRDLGLLLGIEIDKAGIQGASGGNDPDGILNTGSIGDVAIDTNGGPPTWDHIVELETDVATANADIGSLAYLTSPKGRGKLKTVGRKEAGDTASFSFVWADDGTVNGYRAAVSTNVPDDLTKGTLVNAATAIIFGNWMDAVIGLWGTLDIKPDPYSDGDADNLIIRAFQDADVGFRHPESFSAIQDADCS